MSLRVPRPAAALLGAVGLCAALLASSHAPARAAAENWREILETFKDTWVVDGLDEPGVRSKLRAQKRDAVKGLRGSADGRAVPVLLDAHERQLKFIDALRKQWAERKRKWEKLAPAMRQSIGAKQQKAGPGNPISVTPGEQEWMKEKDRLDNLYREIGNEEEIAEYTRKAAARVVNTVTGKEREDALEELFDAAGEGRDDDEREFVRTLGYVVGEDVRVRLEALAGSMNPFAAQAALGALGRQNDPKSVDTLLARLDDPRWQLRVAALQGLAFYREERVVDALLARLKDEDGVLRRHYYETLARIWGEAVPGTPEAYVSWWTAHRDNVLSRWARGDREGPVADDLPPIMVPGGHGDSTSFYGLRTDSKHIIFVIDVSGSMGEQGGKDEQGRHRIEVAKLELTNAIRSLTAEESDERGAASFNVVSYNAQVQVFKSGRMVEATKANKDRVFRWIEKLQADGATNIHDALLQAFDILNTQKAARQHEHGADTIFLMTDGQPTAGKVMDPELIRAEIRKINRDRKITIHTIGVGDGHDANFLRKLAEENHGEYLAR